MVLTEGIMGWVPSFFYMLISFPFYINTVINKDVDDLDCQRVSIEERKGTLMKTERDELREQ